MMMIMMIMLVPETTLTRFLSRKILSRSIRQESGTVYSASTACIKCRQFSLDRATKLGHLAHGFLGRLPSHPLHIALMVEGHGQSGLGIMGGHQPSWNRVVLVRVDEEEVQCSV